MIPGSGRARLLLLAWYYPPHIGGAENVAQTWAETLAAAGWDVRVLTATQTPARSRAGVCIRSLPELAPDPEGLESPQAVKEAVRDELDRFQPDLILSHQLAYPLAPRKSQALLDLFSARGIPVADVSHNAHLRDPAWSRRLLSRSMTTRIAVSKFVKRCVDQLSDGKASMVLHNPVDTTRFRPNPVERMRVRRRLGLRPDDRVVLFPSRFYDIDGSLSTAKQGAAALSAFAAAYRMDPRLRLLLAQPINRTLKRLLRRLGLLSAVRAPRHATSFGDMPGLYNASDANLVLSQEGFGLVYVEALATGKPVVALRAGAAPDMLKGLTHDVAPRPQRFLAKRAARAIIAAFAEPRRPARGLRLSTRRRFGLRQWKKRAQKIALELLDDSVLE